MPDTNKELLRRSYVCLLVMATVLRKAKLDAKPAEQLLRDIAKKYPEFPAWSALR